MQENQNNQHNNGPMSMPPANNNPIPAQMPAQTNTMAILSLVFAFIFSVLGIVFGIIALNQIKQTGENGKGLAIAGLITSSVFTLIGIAYIIFLVIIIITTASSSPSYY